MSQLDKKGQAVTFCQGGRESLVHWFKQKLQKNYIVYKAKQAKLEELAPLALSLLAD